MKRLFILIFFLLTSTAWCEYLQIIANNDGHVYTSQSTYAAARDASSGTSGTNDLRVGQTKIDEATFRIYRSFLSFNIPYMQSVSACTLFVNGNYDFSSTDFNIYIVGAGNYAPTLDNGDFSHFDGRVTGGNDTGTLFSTLGWTSASYSADWNSMGAFGQAGRDSVFATTGDTLRVALLSSRDYYNTEPSTVSNELVIFESSANATFKPYLAITYTPIVASKQSTHFRNKNGIIYKLNSDGKTQTLWSK